MLFVLPIMFRRLRLNGQAGRGHLGGRTWAEQTQDAGVLEAGRMRSGGRTTELYYITGGSARGKKVKPKTWRIFA